ncbi:MAG: 50S ribosomal protein L29 [Phycisphaerales bacterium JB063]
MPIKKTELHKMSDPEIVEETGRLRARMFELRQQAVTEKLENNREPGNIRRDIARLLTEKRMRELKKEAS